MVPPAYGRKPLTRMYLLSGHPSSGEHDQPLRKAIAPVALTRIRASRKTLETYKVPVTSYTSETEKNA